MVEWQANTIRQNKLNSLILNSIEEEWPNLLYAWAAYRKTYVEKSRNIKI